LYREKNNYIFSELLKKQKDIIPSISSLTKIFWIKHLHAKSSKFFFLSVFGIFIVDFIKGIGDYFVGIITVCEFIFTSNSVISPNL